MENWRFLALHIGQRFQNLRSHLEDFIGGKSQVALGVFVQILSLQQLHQRKEQATGNCPVIMLKLYNIGMMQFFQRIKFIDGVINRGILFEYLDGKILFLHIVPHLEYPSKTTFTQNFVKRHTGRNLHTGFHILEV